MDRGNYWNRRLSRRGVLRTAAIGGTGLAGAALIGCGGDEDDPDTGATAAATDSGGGAGTAAATAEGSSDAKRGGTLAYHLSAEPPNFDMYGNSTYAVSHALVPVYNTLVQFDPMIPAEPPEAVIPDLAESWEISEDGTQYTFTLVENAKYQNGQALTSADVKASYERIMDPPEGVVSVRRDQFASIESIDTPDDVTVVLNLSRPAASLLSILATSWNVIYSAEDIGNDVDFQQHVNGTGPFRFEEYQRGNRVVLVRNDEYHVPEYPYLDGINIFIIPDNSTALTSFQSGELNLARTPTPTDIESIEGSIGDEVQIEGPMPSLNFGSVNFGQRDPWRDDRVRRAMAMAVNQEEGIAIYNLGSGYEGGYFVPGGVWAISEDELRTVPGYEVTDEAAYAEARKLLDAAGVANPYQTTILTRLGASYERLSLLLRDQFLRIGIEAELDTQETASAYDTLNDRSFDMAPWGHGYALDDPDALFAEFYNTGAPRNYSELGSAEVDDLFARQSSELDHEARVEIVHDMEKAALALYGKIIVSWSSAREARYNYFRDRVKHPSLYNNQRYERVWFDL